jgi:hypothetical protein
MLKVYQDHLGIEGEVGIKTLIGLHLLHSMLVRVDLRGSHDQLPWIFLLVQFRILFEFE